jgi:hypothetical protein
LLLLVLLFLITSRCEEKQVQFYESCLWIRELQSVHPVRPAPPSFNSFLGITTTYVGASGERKLCSLVGILKQEDTAFLLSALKSNTSAFCPTLTKRTFGDIKYYYNSL